MRFSAQRRTGAFVGLARRATRFAPLVVAFALASLVDASRVSAQARGASAGPVRGVVNDTLLGSPVSAAVITVLDSAGASIGRTIADGQGRFTVTVAPRAAKLRVLRIGYRPREVALPADGAAELNFAMERIAPLLDAVRVSDRELCPGSEEHGAAFQLWEQARAGLLATVVA
ncbi:MAG TPA: carboxypeptidase-like regulatory domain-containing protein, partial [Gemmatimonadaceae bacterium]